MLHGSRTEGVGGVATLAGGQQLDLGAILLLLLPPGLGLASLTGACVPDSSTNTLKTAQRCPFRRIRRCAKLTRLTRCRRRLRCRREPRLLTAEDHGRRGSHHTEEGRVLGALVRRHSCTFLGAMRLRSRLCSRCVSGVFPALQLGTG